MRVTLGGCVFLVMVISSVITCGGGQRRTAHRHVGPGPAPRHSQVRRVRQIHGHPGGEPHPPHGDDNQEGRRSDAEDGSDQHRQSEEWFNAWWRFTRDRQTEEIGKSEEDEGGWEQEEDPSTWGSEHDGPWGSVDTGTHPDLPEVGGQREATDPPLLLSEVRRRGDRPLDGPDGSVCSREVLESEFHDERVGYPCWKSKRVRCSQCGESCRRINRQCYRLTLQTCYYRERRCRKRWQTRNYCCPGYEQVENSCQLSGTDCQQDNGGCEHYCLSESQDNHRCECFSGYRLVDGTRCEDIDECEVNKGGCSQDCVNTEGSYYCACKNGYRLDDPFTCREINECDTANGGCAHQCYNTQGAFYCECDDGFMRIYGSKCTDIDECAGSTTCSHNCYNSPGSYICSCPQGMWLNKADNMTCLGTDANPASADDKLGIASGTALLGDSGVAIIAGGVGGGVVVLCLIVLLVYVMHRSRMTTSLPDGTEDGSNGRGVVHGYESTRRDLKEGDRNDPPQYNNHAYDKLDQKSMVRTVPVQGAHHVLMSPPSYLEATAPPPSEVHSYLALGYEGNVRAASGIYEPIDYSAIGNDGMCYSMGYVNRGTYGGEERKRTPTLPTPRANRLINDKTPSSPVMSKLKLKNRATPSPKRKLSSASMTPIGEKELANAMKSLKKVDK